MPGSGFELLCTSCGARHGITTGADMCGEHGEVWGYEQRVCKHCQTLVSVPTGCHHREGPCPTCGRQLSEWSGDVWFDKRPDGRQGPERVEGPCPRCGATLGGSESSSKVLHWD